MTKLNRLVTKINIEMTGGTRPYLVSAKQGDKATRYILAKLLDNGKVYVIPVEARAVINIKKPDGKRVYNSCEHDTTEVVIELTNQILAAAGTAYCDIEIRTEDNTQVITSASFEIEIEEAIRSDGAIKSTNEFTELENKFADIKDTDKKIRENEERRIEAENDRKNNEIARVEAENDRKNNENNRIEQEKKRQKDAEQSIKSIEKAKEAAETATNDCKKAIELAEGYESQAESYAKEAKSWAIGEGGVRNDEAINNAKYFVEKAQKIVDAAGSGGLIPMGTVTFANLPASDIKTGWMYNISDDFTSDSRFEDGGNIHYRAGANIYYTAGGKWDVLTGIQVTGVKGNSETDYRTGNVNITKENIGLGNVPNVDTNNQTPTFAQNVTRENITSGEKLSVIFGKIVKWFHDLKTVAFTGSYDDLTNKPTISAATQSANGLMSAADKKKLDGIAAGANKISLTNNLLANAAGVSALDAALGPVIDERFNAINSNLSKGTFTIQNDYFDIVIDKYLGIVYVTFNRTKKAISANDNIIFNVPKQFAPGSSKTEMRAIGKAQIPIYFAISSTGEAGIRFYTGVSAGTTLYAKMSYMI